MSRPRSAARLTLVALLAAGLTACEEGIPPPLPESQVQLTASPTTVNSTGGTVTLTATVTEDGEPVVGQTVTFTASPSTSGAPNPATVPTNSTGVATTTLVLANPPAQIIVTASAGALGSANATITAQ